MSKPIVAIVGRPNVGKSTLFNKLIGERRSIVEDVPGVTRDRIYGNCEWDGREMLLVDTGGIDPGSDDVITTQTRYQAQIAIESADVIIFMCDIRCALVHDDVEIAMMLKRSGKPVVVCVNKCDSSGDPPPEFYEFYELGFDSELIAVSSVHGTGTGDLLDAVVSLLPDDSEEEPDDSVISVAVIGKPNAGKSSMINRMLGSERHIVSNIPGTTREADDSLVSNEFGNFNFIDTAGIRRKSKVEDSVEYYSVLRAKMAVERADVCLIMIDAKEGISEQDSKIAGIAHESGKAPVIVVNKWDLIEKDNDSVRSFSDSVYKELSFMTYAPLVFVSALTGQRVSKIYEMINSVFAESRRRITTGSLNDVLADAMNRCQPPTDKGKRLKIYYMTQVSVSPPSFVVFCNDTDLFHFSYQRFIENSIRGTFGFSGTPIKLIVRQKGDEHPK